MTIQYFWLPLLCTDMSLDSLDILYKMKIDEIPRFIGMAFSEMFFIIWNYLPAFYHRAANPSQSLLLKDFWAYGHVIS